MSGDFIVGFPGEDEADFDATLDLCRSVRYAQAYSFKYSARPGTPAAEREEVAEEEKSERLQRLQALLNEHQADFQASMVGRTMPVLLEKPGRLPGQMVGKSPYLQAVHLQADESRKGKIVEARILSSERNSLGAKEVVSA
jgi:tRNA-2-methylthio-N6-dimethylallyladenosine synthase